MRYLALATDYDETLATSGRLTDDAIRAIERLRASGRRAILVTGRTLEDLSSVCPNLDLFAAVVVENGAVLHLPAERDTTVLCAPVVAALVTELTRRGVEPLVRGHALLATQRPHELAVLEAIRDLGLELQIIFNGEAVMVLPSGINKGSGLQVALRELGLSLHEVVGIGNAENDHSFLDVCECAVAVNNAIDAVKAKADFITGARAGAGVVELISELLATDLSGRSPGGAGDVLLLANRRDGTPATIRPYGQNILVCGPSGAGKSTFATGFIERLLERDYQLCVIDPEGDYGTMEGIATIGNRSHPPHLEEIESALSDARSSVVVNLMGMSLEARPELFSQLFPRLQAMRGRAGRPHWVLVDEVHHLLPAAWGLAPLTLPQRLGETVLVTDRPSNVAPAILSLVDVALIVGPSPGETLAELAGALGVPTPSVPSTKRKEAVIWERTTGLDPYPVTILPARSDRLRHLRKYAEGDLGPRSFFFRGPHNRLNLRAANLVSFCQLAHGIDDDTWSFHLHRGDYSKWLAAAIKDDDLAHEVAAVEQEQQIGAWETRQRICDAIDKRYVLQR